MTWQHLWYAAVALLALANWFRAPEQGMTTAAVAVAFIGLFAKQVNTEKKVDVAVANMEVIKVAVDGLTREKLVTIDDLTTKIADEPGSTQAEIGVSERAHDDLAQHDVTQRHIARMAEQHSIPKD